MSCLVDASLLRTLCQSQVKNIINCIAMPLAITDSSTITALRALYAVPCKHYHSSTLVTMNTSKVFISKCNMFKFCLKSVPLTIVIIKGFVCKPGISTRTFVPQIGTTAAICHKNIYILLADDVMLTVYKVTSLNIRSPLMKTLPSLISYKNC